MARSLCSCGVVVGCTEMLADVFSELPGHVINGKEGALLLSCGVSMCLEDVEGVGMMSRYAEEMSFDAEDVFRDAAAMSSNAGGVVISGGDMREGVEMAFRERKTTSVDAVVVF